MRLNRRVDQLEKQVTPNHRFVFVYPWDDELTKAGPTDQIIRVRFVKASGDE